MTKAFGRRCNRYVISIHTPARGVTRLQMRLEVINDISIHTPARGVTQTKTPTIVNKKYFNPHSRKGSDIFCRWCFISVGYFNPHSRKGSDLYPSKVSTVLLYFNPHSRKGSDLSFHIWPVPLNISIHTPARGVTDTAIHSVQTKAISIHTPARGVTKTVSMCRRKILFQSTLPQGE